MGKAVAFDTKIQGVTRFLCEREVCAIMQVSRVTLSAWIKAGKAPAPRRFGNMKR